MSSTTVQLVNSRTTGIYDPSQHIGMWRDPSRGINTSSNVASSMVQLVDSGIDNRLDYASPNPEGSSNDEQRGGRSADKIQRRLAQNREAARKSRLRKKAYVQQLETSRLKLAQLEQELRQAKQQNFYAGNSNVGFVGNYNSGIATFEMEYSIWVEEQHRWICELRNALQANISDVELQILIDGSLNHYYKLLRLKMDASKEDVFYLMSGMWRSSVERFFHWIGGVRPSELLIILRPHIEPLTEQQVAQTVKLQHSSQQAEDALSQGLEKLQQNLIQVMSSNGFGGELFASQMASGMEKLKAFEGFLYQADNLREQNLQLMSRILSPNQAARGLLALGEYFNRLRALSTLWSARPRTPAIQYDSKG